MRAIYPPDRFYCATHIESIFAKMVLKAHVIKAQFTRPFTHRLSLASELKPTIVVRLVILLYQLCRPAAVLRRVWTIIIDTVDAVLVAWPPAHVGEESGIRLAPGVAYLNPSSSVIVKSRSLVIQASHFDVDPRLIFDCGVFAILSVLIKRLSAHTPARFEFAGAQGADLSPSFLSAFAAAPIHSSDRGRYRSAHDCQIVEDRTDCEWNWVGHKHSIFLRSVS